MSGSICIFGTGGHAREVAEVVYALGRTPIFVTQDKSARERWSNRDSIMLEETAVNIRHAEFAIGIGDNAARARVAASYPHLRFPALVHPDTSLARGQREAVDAAPGTILFAGVRMMVGVTVGSFCTFNINVTVSHDSDVGDFATLAPGANIAGNVRIGSCAWIGAGAVVNQGTAARKLEIGANTIVGSGTVVLGDCAPNSVYVGNPARKIR